MTGHGGARRGAGRKLDLTFTQEMEVGGECERIWRARALENAEKAYEARPYVGDIRQEQLPFQSTPIVKRKNTQVRKDLEEFSEGIDDIVREAVQRGEVLPVAVKRPYNANNSVIDEAIEWCANKHKKQISRTRAQKLG